MPNPKWITTLAAHQSTGIPKRTIIAAINRGDLKADKLPGLTGSFLINPAELDAWLSRREAKATA
jgi:hypothetical protein